MFSAEYGEQVTRLPFTGWELDAHRKKVAAYGPPQPVDGVVFNPGTSEESGATGRTVTTEPTIYLPYGTEASEHDQWVVRGTTFEADGVAATWRNPLTGTAAGVVVALRRVTG